MIRTPNAFQKLLHRFFMLRPVTAFFAGWVHRADRFILRWTRGRFAASQILGWPIVELTTIGAKTNQLHTMPLVGVFDREKIALIASSLGRAHNPGWYYNLKAHPECEVEFKGRSHKYRAREITGEEYEHYWKLAISLYAGYDKYRQRAARHIPVMLLEPKK
jgi:deazaflavin-dependent oxidoreductase (nitroreductase family)